LVQPERFVFTSSALTCAKIPLVRRRFFVEHFSDRTAAMQGETAHHLGRVLRAQPGQLFELSDGSKVYLGRIETVTRDRIDFVLEEEIPAYLPAIDKILLLSVVKFDALEWALEKATELGVAAIIPIAPARSERALIAAAGKRAGRWKKILIEASQQSRRVRVPRLEPLTRPAQAFDGCPDGAKIMLSERIGVPMLRDVLRRQPAPTSQAVLAIGPEGGWTEEEFEIALAAGFQEASLGKLILRTETAVIAALASLNFALEA
jgi:16S rRNA (uracil1498-N3)-methyltransferase